MSEKQTIVISGGSRGLGRSIAESALASGYSVALIARGKKDLELARSELSGKVTIHTVDLTDEAAVTQAVDDIAREHPFIVGVVNNAGTWTPSPEDRRPTVAEIRKSMELNFFSAVHLTEALLAKRGSGPLSIVNIGATASLQGWPEVLPFSLAKGALRSYSQALARGLGPQGIHVSHVIIDGMIDNERTREMNEDTPSDRFMDPRSIAASVLHLIRQEKSCWTFELDLRPFNEQW